MRKFVSIVFEHFLSHAAAKKRAKNLKSLHLFYSQDKTNIDILYINRIRLDQISDHKIRPLRYHLDTYTGCFIDFQHEEYVIKNYFDATYFFMTCVVLIGTSLGLFRRVKIFFSTWRKIPGDFLAGVEHNVTPCDTYISYKSFYIRLTKLVTWNWTIFPLISTIIC